MLAEIVILLAIANVIFIILIIKQLQGTGFKTAKVKKTKAEEEEEYEDDDPEPEPIPEPEPEKVHKFNIAEKLHLKKKEKTRKHVSEMPDMNRVIEELQSEFKKGSKKTQHKRKDEIQDRLEEIEKS
ncbi:hypothetical protein JW851_00955 [Candidatus Woesearchaeota archaeon]|nr:hypothetical protein [Candidatus Woesearchaeota archaeon]